MALVKHECLFDGTLNKLKYRAKNFWCVKGLGDNLESITYDWFLQRCQIRFIIELEKSAQGPGCPVCCLSDKT